MTAEMDSGMREIVVEFCRESYDLFDELENHLEQFEEDITQTKKLEKFGQVIDRIMGAAKSIQADEIATFCELGKLIGYKSSQTDNKDLLNVVVAILFDAVDLLRRMVEKLETGENHGLESLNTSAFVKRLKWLSDKFKDIDRASCSYDKKGVGSNAQDNLSQNSIDDLMSSLGL